MELRLFCYYLFLLLLRKDKNKMFANKKSQIVGISNDWRDNNNNHKYGIAYPHPKTICGQTSETFAQSAADLYTKYKELNPEALSDDEIIEKYLKKRKNNNNNKNNNNSTNRNNNNNNNSNKNVCFVQPNDTTKKYIYKMSIIIGIYR